MKTGLIPRQALALALVLAFAAAAGLGAQLKLPKASGVPLPTAEITAFELSALSLRDATFRFELTVKNPYPVELSFSGMTMNFSVEGRKVLAVKDQGGFKVPAGKTKASVFEVALAYEGVIALVKDYVEKEWLDTSIDGRLTIPLPRLAAFPGLPPEASFDYKLAKRIPAIKPKVEIRAFTVKAPGPEAVAKGLAAASSKAKPEAVADYLGALAAGRKPAAAPVKPTDIDVPFTVGFTLAIRNEAKGALGFEGLDYGLAIGGVDLLKGRSGKVRREGNATLVDIESTFSSRKLAQAVIDVFAARKGDFRVTGQASLALPKEIRPTPVPLAFDESGSFSM